MWVILYTNSSGAGMYIFVELRTCQVAEKLLIIIDFASRGFVAYLKGAPNYNLQMYKELVNQITTTFNNISKDILSIEQGFGDSGIADISGTIRKIQESEQLKQKTVSVQLLLALGRITELNRIPETVNVYR